MLVTVVASKNATDQKFTQGINLKGLNEDVKERIDRTSQILVKLPFSELVVDLKPRDCQKRDGLIPWESRKIHR